MASSAHTKIYVCHDYQPGGREPKCETTVEEERKSNIHVKEGTTKEQFIAWRQKRDSTLGFPKLILPSIQVNINGGRFPPSENNGKTYLKLPINVLKAESNTGIVPMVDFIQLHKDIYVSGQVGIVDVYKAGKMGIKTIINVRPKDEQGFFHEEEEIAKKCGLKYLHHPIKTAELTQDQMNTIISSIDSCDKPALIHCASAKRGTLASLLHLHKKGVFSPEEVLKKAKERGIDENATPQMHTFMQQFIN
jgi:uncharacterized protein (TIGR01244 family)